ncbi:hypothetical protein SEA_FIRECASTLE_39 [Microbacterium phage FireCastle]
MCAACMDPNTVCTEHGAVERAQPVHKIEVLVDGEWVELGGIKDDGSAMGFRQELEPLTFMGIPFTQVAKDVYEITEEAVIRAPFGTIDHWQRELSRLAGEQGVTIWYEHDRLRRVWRFKVAYEGRLPRG